MDKQARLDTLKSICLTCGNCALASTRKHVVFGEGSCDPVVLFLGEAPGRTENDTGRPFVGRSGQLLRKMIQAIGLDPVKDCYIANIIKCWPPGNREPEKAEREECVKFLHKQIQILNPQKIVLLGKTAIRGLFPHYSAVSVESLREMTKKGELTFNATYPVIITYHPSALLRDPSRRTGTAEDFRFIQQSLKKIF